MEKNYLQDQHNEAEKFARREADWRNGSIVYQIIVDRFVPPENLEAKRRLYPAPKRLRDWSETPTRGVFLPEVHVWSHEIDFWGGDLRSAASRLDYLADLGIDVLYLNPIHAAFTNHKYDATDYLQVSPEYGTFDDLRELTEKTHRAGMKLVLDGVFNHAGRQSSLFQEAAASPDSPRRDWFYFSDAYSQGVRLWANARSLPELNYENPAVKDFIFARPDSVVRTYLRSGIDGWRLDTAFELGFQVLHELTQAAHEEKPGSLVVGEIWSYPQDWFPALDAVMNFTLREIILNSLQEKISPRAANEMIDRMIADAGIEPILKSWVLLDNHDVARLTNTLPDPADRALAQVLQFTLPGSPNLYYGSELGMEGGTDPANRAPMRWDLAHAGNPVYCWVKKLIELRKKHRALRIGDFRKLVSGNLIAFERFTEKVDETILVIANPAGEPVEETILAPDSKLMNGSKLVDLLSGGTASKVWSGLIHVRLEPKSALVLKPETEAVDGYTPYKRIP